MSALAVWYLEVYIDEDGNVEYILDLSAMESTDFESGVFAADKEPEEEDIHEMDTEQKLNYMDALEAVFDGVEVNYNPDVDTYLDDDMFDADDFEV